MKPSLHQEIVALLETFPVLQNEDGRKAVLLRAGLDALMPQLDFRGPTATYVSLLINTLDRYGSLPDGQLAIEQFLQAVAAQVGPDRQKVLQGFCERYEQEQAKQGLSGPQKPQRDEALSIVHWIAREHSPFPILGFTLANRTKVSQIITACEVEITCNVLYFREAQTRELKPEAFWDIVLSSRPDFEKNTCSFTV